VALNIKSDEADRLARHLAQVAGESLTEAVTQALRERLARLEGRRRRRGLREDVARMQERLADLPRLDGRTDEEILGYDGSGLPA
jgi:antitoxin VapB